MIELHFILYAGFVISAFLFILWLIQVRTGNAGIADAGWACGIGILAVLYAVWGHGNLVRRVLMAGLIGAWSLRLAGYILLDRVIGKPEDGRYQELRNRWGNLQRLYFFLFFQAQALLCMLFSIPFFVIAHDPRPVTGPREILAVLIWCVAVFGESIADRQLARFRASQKNSGKTCQQGLWRYSRHPNYFFEWLHWWSYVALAWGAPFGWVSLLGPALMLLFLYRITGIAITEAHALKTRSDYAEYQCKTSPFLPWFPKKGTSEQ